ncbi:MAG: hypothetical protein WC465_01630 [Patescibacteria group bacterium]
MRRCWPPVVAAILILVSATVALAVQQPTPGSVWGETTIITTGAALTMPAARVAQAAPYTLIIGTEQNSTASCANLAEQPLVQQFEQIALVQTGVTYATAAADKAAYEAAIPRQHQAGDNAGPLPFLMGSRAAPLLAESVGGSPDTAILWWQDYQSAVRQLERDTTVIA